MENQTKALLPENITNLVIDSGNLLTIQEIRRNATKLGIPSLPTEEVLQIFGELFVLIDKLFICSVGRRSSARSETETTEWKSSDPANSW